MKDLLSSNPDILQRISESEIEAWFDAKMNALREETKLPVHSIGFTAAESCARGRPHYGYWNVHAADKCAHEDTTAQAVNKLREDLMGNPKQRAAQKRFDARLALEEAEKLELLAAANPE